MDAAAGFNVLSYYGMLLSWLFDSTSFLTVRNCLNDYLIRIFV